MEEIARASSIKSTMGEPSLQLTEAETRKEECEEKKARERSEADRDHRQKEFARSLARFKERVLDRIEAFECQKTQETGARAQSLVVPVGDDVRIEDRENVEERTDNIDEIIVSLPPDNVKVRFENGQDANVHPIDASRTCAAQITSTCREDKFGYRIIPLVHRPRGTSAKNCRFSRAGYLCISASFPVMLKPFRTCERAPVKTP